MSSRAGITLVELLTGLVITALIATILSSSLVQLFDRAGRLERARVSVEADLAAVSAFRRVVERAVVLPAIESAALEEDRGGRFHLTGEAMYWTAAEPGYPGEAGLYAYGLEIGRTAGGWTLVLLRAPLLGDYPAGAELGESLDGSERTPVWTGADKPLLLAFDSAAQVWTGQWEDSAPPALAGLALPGMPVAVARLPHGQSGPAGQDAQEEGPREDTPGIGRIERAPDETP